MFRFSNITDGSCSLRCSSTRRVRVLILLSCLIRPVRLVAGFLSITKQLSRERIWQVPTGAKSEGDDLLRELNSFFSYDGRLPAKENFRCGFVSILGAPNMGKSTLLNALLQEDLSVATKWPQTTRHAILGIITTNDCQLCLVDTPGIIENPAYKLQEGMMEAVIGAFHDSDVLLVVTDIFSTPIPDDKIFQKVRDSGKPTIVVINKVDLAGSTNAIIGNQTVSVTNAVANWRSLLPNALAIFPVCASEGPENEGIVALRKLLLGGDNLPHAIRSLGRPIPGMFKPGHNFLTDDDAKALLPKSPPLYDEENLTDRTERYACILFHSR